MLCVNIDDNDEEELSSLFIWRFFTFEFIPSNEEYTRKYTVRRFRIVVFEAKIYDHRTMQVIQIIYLYN